MVERRIFVNARLQAFHTDPRGIEGRHLHVWTVKAYVEDEPFPDERDELRPRLKALLAPYHNRDLPPELWATEDLAAWVLTQLGEPFKCVILDRTDGCGAEVRL